MKLTLTDEHKDRLHRNMAAVEALDDGSMEVSDTVILLHYYIHHPASTLTAREVYAQYDERESVRMCLMQTWMKANAMDPHNPDHEAAIDEHLSILFDDSYNIEEE